jgi:hypothetical protein
LRGTLVLFNLLRHIIDKLGSHDKTIAAEFDVKHEALNRETGEKFRSLHRQALFESVGLTLSHWAGMGELLVAIASLLLRTHEARKVGIVLYSISFNIWLSIIGELFLQEPRYITLKPRWNKISERLRGLKDTRDRLAHHTIYEGDQATTIKGDSSLRPSRFDLRQKSQKYQPLDLDQIYKFSDSLIKVHGELTVLLNSMTDLLTRETSQENSSEPTSDQHPP